MRGICLSVVLEFIVCLFVRKVLREVDMSMTLPPRVYISFLKVDMLFGSLKIDSSCWNVLRNCEASPMEL